MPKTKNQPLLSGARARWLAVFPGKSWLCLLLGLVTLAVFWPARNFDFINYNDPLYVTANPYVRQGLTPGGLVWAFTAFRALSWQPVAWISHMFDVQAFGLNPAGPHWVNVFLHAANAILLFLLLKKFTGAPWRSAMVAGLFALHPLHVESVAWISERKDLLGTLFLLLTLWAYGRYALKPAVGSQPSPVNGQSAAGDATREAAGERQETAAPVEQCSGETAGASRRGRLDFVRQPMTSRSYRMALVFFALGLMTESVVAVLPLLMLLMDYWPLCRVEGSRLQVEGRTLEGTGENEEPATPGDKGRRILNPWGLIREKVPFFVLSAISCVLALSARAGAGADASPAVVPAGTRIANAFVDCTWYLAKAFRPVHLAVPYPHPVHWPTFRVAVAVLLVVALCAGAVWQRRRLPFLFTGWFWFLGTLIPAIGLVQSGGQPVADHNSYVPFIGLFVALVWGAATLFKRWRIPQLAAAAAALAVLGICAVRSRDQLNYWRNSGTLFRHTLAVTGDNYQACDFLGAYLNQQGHWKEALGLYHRALDINPADDVAYSNMGSCYYGLGRLDEAIANFRHAQRINPNNANTLSDLGSALIRRKDYREAIPCLKAALRLQPDLPEAHINLGVALDHVGRTDEAISHFVDALRLAPDSAEAHNDFANALIAKGKVAEAIHHYDRALKLDPHFTQAWNNMGWVLARLGHYDDAVSCFTRALQFKPNDEMLHRNLGNVLAAMGKDAEAVKQYRQALKLAPNDPETHFALGRALAGMGRRDEAMAHLKEALRLRPGYAKARQELSRLQRPPRE